MKPTPSGDFRCFAEHKLMEHGYSVFMTVPARMQVGTPPPGGEYVMSYGQMWCPAGGVVNDTCELKLRPDEAHALMDALWAAGLRPSKDKQGQQSVVEPTESAAMQALKDHLADTRALNHALLVKMGIHVLRPGVSTEPGVGEF